MKDIPQALHTWLEQQKVPLDKIDKKSVLWQLIQGPEGLSQQHLPPLLTIEPLRVLTLICQKIGSTGSGVVVKEIIERAVAHEIKFLIICGSEPGDKPKNSLPSRNVDVQPLWFKTHAPDALPFPIVGMSDGMPYDSTRFKDLNFSELNYYLETWGENIRRAIEKFKPHLIHVHHLWLLAAVSAITAPKHPHIVSIHGTDLQQAESCDYLRKLVEPWVKRFEKLIALSDESVYDTERLYDCINDRFSILGNGFNDKLFFPSDNPSEAVLKHYNLLETAQQQVVLFIGKYVEWKGIEWLIKAFAKLAPSLQDDTMLVIGGTGPDSERDRYHTLIHHLGIKNKVVLTGKVRYQDVGALMNMARVFVMPSFREPFGLVLLEALACGTRVVASNQGGPSFFVPDQLKQNRDAILIPGLPTAAPPPSSATLFVDDLSAAITEQLSKSLSYGQRCHITDTVRHLTWDTYVTRLIPVYRQLAHEN